MYDRFHFSKPLQHLWRQRMPTLPTIWCPAFRGKGRNSTGAQLHRCREQPKLSALRTCIVSGRGHQPLGTGARCPSEEHSMGYGHREISQVGKPAHSKHSSGQNTCSQGWTNSMFATHARTIDLQCSLVLVNLIGSNLRTTCRWSDKWQECGVGSCARELRSSRLGP